MADVDIDFDLTGITKMVKALDAMGKSPQKAVNRAASKGITPVKRAIKSAAPVGKTGNLKRAIIRQPEPNRRRGMKSYVVTFNSAYNDVLQKDIKYPGTLGGKSKKAYYPASLEYGFLARAHGGGYVFYSDNRRSFLTKKRGIGKKDSAKRVEGLHFMRDAAEDSEPQATIMIVDTLDTELDKLWKEMEHK